MVDTQQPTEHKESFFEKILDQHHHKHGNEGQTAKDKPQGGLRSDLEKGEAGVKQYLKEDEQLEEEGQTYGGLM
jgi:hypothetical protein